MSAILMCILLCREGTLSHEQELPTYLDPGEFKRQAAPDSHDVYTVPEKKAQAARVEEAGPMYQDPDTINRQPAPESGQLYSVEPTKKASSRRKPPVAPAKTDAELAEMYFTPNKSRQREVGPVGGARAERGGEVCMWHGEWGRGGGGEESSAYLAPLHVLLIPIFGHSYYTCPSAWEFT